MDRTPLQDEDVRNTDLGRHAGLLDRSVTLPGVGPVRISVDAEDDEEITPEDAFQNAHRAYLALRDKEPAARAFAAEALLDVYNREWNQGEPIDEDAFIEQSALEDISFPPTAAWSCSTTPPTCSLATLSSSHSMKKISFDDVEIAG